MNDATKLGLQRALRPVSPPRLSSVLDRKTQIPRRHELVFRISIAISFSQAFDAPRVLRDLDFDGFVLDENDGSILRLCVVLARVSLNFDDVATMFDCFDERIVHPHRTIRS